MKNGRIAGTGSYVPETIWKNEDLEKMVETSDAWIRERTGIGARHIAGEETVAQMAVKAARRALENAGICSTELDLILVGTSSSESIFPNTACLVQDEIGAFRAACLDVSAACTGFLAVYELGQLYRGRRGSHCADGGGTGDKSVRKDPFRWRKRRVADLRKGNVSADGRPCRVPVCFIPRAGSHPRGAERSRGAGRGD